MEHRINILVVDDNPKILKSAEDALKPEGYNVEGVLTGKEAINKVSQNNYDLVFTDVKMPEMDGITLIKLIKDLRPSIGIVVISGYLLQEPIKEAHKLGIISHVRKPFTRIQLKDITNKALEWIRENDLGDRLHEVFPPEKLAELDQVIHQYRKMQNSIIQVLLHTQYMFGYLPSEILMRIAQDLDVYPSELRSIVSFYPCFRTKSDGYHTPCYIKGSEKGWWGVTWKTGTRVLNAVNEFIEWRQKGYS